MTEITEATRCGVCGTESKAPEVGIECPRSGCEYGTIVRVLTLGPRSVEISRRRPDANLEAAGFVSGALSREFGIKDYKTLAGAERSSKRWLSRYA